jgi:hypothetical protein
LEKKKRVFDKNGAIPLSQTGILSSAILSPSIVVQSFQPHKKCVISSIRNVSSLKITSFNFMLVLCFKFIDKMASRQNDMAPKPKRNEEERQTQGTLIEGKGSRRFTSSPS